MKDFQVRNDKKLLYRSDPVEDIAGYVKGRAVRLWRWLGKEKRLLR